MTATLLSHRHAAKRSGPTEKTRADIQALRAVAVVSVVLYHLWPNRLSGGYVGVDVFFVISGFLITSHLLAHPPRRFTELLQFWSRRIRRLLPASLLVLLVTLIATRIVAPDTLWANTARYVRAAALYGVNWRMAGDSVDYLAANDAPTPVQHFWSLSVEEQFYLIWPILIALLVLIARRHAWRAVTVGLAMVTAASFWYSIHDTAVDPAAAYFVTPTRVWELGVGGCLAAALARTRFQPDAAPRWRLPTPARTALAWLGLAAIAWSLFAFTDATPFPSWRAALPVLGAAAVIAAAVRPGLGSPLPIMSWRPVQWLGNISYSIYLWHWPLLALLPYKSGGHLGRLDKAAIIVATLVLSALTKRYIEDRFRTPNWARPLPKPYALGAAAMALVVAASLLQTTEVHRRESVAVAALQKQLADRSQPCFGAAAIAHSDSCQVITTTGTLYPSPVQAAQDKSDAYASVSGKKQCFADQPGFKIITCAFGDLGSHTDVALVGNSHAGQWLPTVERIADAEHWRITTYLASDCALNLAPQDFQTPAGSKNCQGWVRGVTNRLASGAFNLVILADRLSRPVVGQPLAARYPYYQTGYGPVLTQLSTKHVHLVAIRDTPYPGGVSVPDCLGEHPHDYSSCNGPRKSWLEPDPLAPAISKLNDRNITEIDATKYFCRGDVCPAVIGSVPVYFDGSHVSATYAKTLAPYLAPYLTKAMQAR